MSFFSAVHGQEFFRVFLKGRGFGLAAAACIACLLPVGSVRAQSADEVFYKANPVTVIVGMSSGTTYDIVGRAVARHIVKHIPGQQKGIPVNRPGAGSLTAAQQVYSASPRDGTVIGVFNRSAPTGPLLGTAPAGMFDATKFNWIGNVGDEVSVCVTRRETAAPTWAELVSKPMSFGATSMGADTGIFAAVLNNMFGAKLKIITGYPGGTEITVALERGEVDGRCGWSLGGIKTSRPQWLSDNTINVPIQLGLRASPELPGVPLILDKARNDNERRLLRLIFSRQEVAYPLAAPPGTSKERVQILRSAFDAMVKDPEFLEEAKKMAIEVAPMSGADLEKLMIEIHATPPELVSEAQRIMAGK